MKKLLFLIVIASAVFSVVALSGCGDHAKVRVIHGSYDAPSVDVSVDGTTKFGGISYGESSGYRRVLAGDRRIEVTPANAAGPVVIDEVLALAGDQRVTVYAVDELEDITAIVSVDDRKTSLVKAKVRFIHASPDAPGVDIKLNAGDGPIVFDDTEFTEIQEYIEVNPGSYTFVVTPANDDTALIQFNPVTLQACRVYTIVALGTFNDHDDVPFFARVFIDSGRGNRFVDLTAGEVSNLMVAHASPDAPPVDVYADGVFQGNVRFPENTGYIVLPAGSREIKVNVEGTDTTVIGPAVLPLGTDAYTTVFAVDRVAAIAPLILTDDLSPPAAGKAKVRFVHCSPDAPSVDITLTDGTVLFGDYAFKEFSHFEEFDAGTVDLQVRLASSSTVVLFLPGITLEDGKIYSVFANGLVDPGPGEPYLDAEIIVNK